MLWQGRLILSCTNLWVWFWLITVNILIRRASAILQIRFDKIYQWLVLIKLHSGWCVGVFSWNLGFCISYLQSPIKLCTLAKSKELSDFYSPIHLNNNWFPAQCKSRGMQHSRQVGKYGWLLAGADERSCEVILLSICYCSLFAITCTYLQAYQSHGVRTRQHESDWWTKCSKCIYSRRKTIQIR